MTRDEFTLARSRSLQAGISYCVGVSRATASRALSRAGLSKLSDLDPAPPPVVRHEHEGLANCCTSTTRSQGASSAPHHRVTGKRISFLKDAVANYVRLQAKVKRLINRQRLGLQPFRSKDFATAGAALGIEQQYTRAYRPQTNGNAERFYQGITS